MKTSLLFCFLLLISGTIYAQNPHKTVDEIIVRPPRFTGLTPQAASNTATIEEYIAKNVAYSENDLKYAREGTEVINFVVNEDGTLSNFRVFNSVSDNFDRQMIELLKQTNGMWEPGSNNDGPVAMERQVSVACKVSFSERSECQSNFQALAADYFNKGAKLLYLKGRPARALANFNKGIAYCPCDPNLRLLSGYSKFALGDKAGAFEDWKIVKEKTNIDHFENLANAYKDLDGHAELVKLLADK